MIRDMHVCVCVCGGVLFPSVHTQAHTLELGVE